MLLVRIKRASPVPIHRQISEQIAALVDLGTLEPGDRLPPTRVLAKTAGIHRSTAVRAYEDLCALGYLESRPGSYSTVRRRARPPSTRAPARLAAPSLLSWSALARCSTAVPAGEAGAASPSSGPSDAVDLARLAADPALAPSDEVKRCLKDALVRMKGAALDYCNPLGLPSLREAIAARMRAHGVAIAPDEVLVTAGAQEGIDLVLRMLSRAGDRAVVERPTYDMAHALLRLHRVAPLEVPMRADGMDLDVLSVTLRRRRPRLIYTMPNFQNPTGLTTSQAHRERLLALCEEHRIPLLEDGFEEEMKYFGSAVLPIKSMDARGVVLYAGTFSKVAFPGLRLGWLAAPGEAIARLASIRHASSLAGNTLVQAAVARFCREGLLERHLRRIHAAYRARMQAMLRALEEHMPPGVEWTRPAGGYTVWLTVRGAAVDEDALLGRILRAGVKVAPGRRFFARAPREPHLRLSIACAGEERIREGCRRLGTALARGR